MTRKKRSSATIRSMTGHGRGEARGKSGSVEIEASSVNRRQLDVRVNIPREMTMLEPMIHDLVGDKVSRGNVTVVVRYTPASARGHLEVDEQLARKYVKELRKLGQSLKLKDDLSLASVMGLPDVVKMVSARKDTGVKDIVKRALGTALQGMLTMREREGQALARDIQKRFKALGDRIKKVNSLSAGVAKRYKKNLLDRMVRSGVELKATSPQVIRELAMFADKADISEELVRLDSHLVQAKDIFAKGGSVGRTLDFLCQEIFREINTIGSKANDSGISRIVVDFKAELEAIREQVQNVE